MKFTYLNNCVNWWRDDVRSKGGLIDMVQDAVEITRRTFVRHVDRQELREQELTLGYCRHPKQGLTMASDGCVRYYKSKLHGELVYFFDNSSIEYVFARPGLWLY